MPRRLVGFMAVLLSTVSCAAPRSSTGVGPVPAGMRVQAEDVFYDVEGKTTQELLSALRANALRTGSSSTFARNAWSVRWSFQYAPGVAQCRMTDARVELTSTTTLPRWTPPSDAAPGLVQMWNTFMAALIQHERGHQAHGVAAAREILHELRSFRAPSCVTMSTDAHRAAERILERYSEQDRLYDSTTRHGRTQGAVWPPGGSQAEGPEQWINTSTDEPPRRPGRTL